MKKLALSLLLGLWVMPSFAQIPVKAEDNFWRRRVAVRVELDEKMNLPFKFHDKSDFQNFRFSETNGIVMAILNAVKDGELTGYDAHTWEVLSGKRILQRMKYLEQAWKKGKNDMEGEKTADKWDNIFVADDAAEYALSASFTEMPSDGMFTTDVYNKKKAHGQWDMT